MEEWTYSFSILNLSTKWRWQVSFTPQPLFLRLSIIRNPPDRRLGGPRNRSGRSGEEKKYCPYRKSTARRYTDWAIPALSMSEERKLQTVHSKKYSRYTRHSTAVTVNVASLIWNVVCSILLPAPWGWNFEDNSSRLLRIFRNYLPDY
jgi:hypothetical protein